MPEVWDTLLESNSVNDLDGDTLHHGKAPNWSVLLVKTFDQYLSEIKF